MQSQEEFFGILEAGVAAKKFPQPLLLAFKDFYLNYKSKNEHLSLSLSFLSPDGWQECQGPPLTARQCPLACAL